jgi:hypothetical protein
VNTKNVDAIALDASGKLLISLASSGDVTGASSVQDEDVIRFTATSLGATTVGSFAFYFDGSDVGLATSTDEDVDGAFLASDGRLYMTTLGDFSVPVTSGTTTPVITGNNDDVLRFQPTSTGPTTAGSYSVFLRGSTIGIPAAANVRAIFIENP